MSQTSTTYFRPIFDRVQYEIESFENKMNVEKRNFCERRSLLRCSTNSSNDWENVDENEIIFGRGRFDFTIYVKTGSANRRIKCDSDVLRRCPFFNAALSSGMKEERDKIMTIFEDVDSVLGILSFMFDTNEAFTDISNLRAIYELADKWCYDSLILHLGDVVSSVDIVKTGDLSLLR